MHHEEALDAVRAGRPLPAGFKLPVLTGETAEVYDALRKGESIDAVAKVRGIDCSSDDDDVLNLLLVGNGWWIVIGSLSTSYLPPIHDRYDRLSSVPSAHREQTPSPNLLPTKFTII